MKEQHIAPGISIVGFENTDEMFAYMAENERAAIEGAVPEQWEITWGDYVIRFVEGLIIWGHVYTEEEYRLGNIRDEVENDEEIEAELLGLRDAHERGYRWGKFYSVVEPTGEYGSAHVVSLLKISKADFDTAMSNGWEIWPELVNRLSRQVNEVLKQIIEGEQ